MTSSWAAGSDRTGVEGRSREVGTGERKSPGLTGTVGKKQTGTQGSETEYTASAVQLGKCPIPRTGEKMEESMKRGDIVKVREGAKYTGQTMPWTEEKTGKIILKKGSIVYHSSDAKLSIFRAKVTCFFVDSPCCGHVYALHITEDITIDSYDTEVRIELNKNSKIQYLGRKYIKYDYDTRVEEFDSCGRSQGWGPKKTIIDNTYLPAGLRR